jgi:hypothetical protein
VPHGHEGGGGHVDVGVHREELGLVAASHKMYARDRSIVCSGCFLSAPDLERVERRVRLHALEHEQRRQVVRRLAQGGAVILAGDGGDDGVWHRAGERAGRGGDSP